MYDCFNHAGNGLTNWLGQDPDKYWIQVTDPERRGDGTMVVSISTQNENTFYNCPATEITLTETAAGTAIFRSQPQLLMSEKKNDEEPWKWKVNHAKDDATHLIAVGGEIWLEYKTKDGQNTIRGNIASVEVKPVIKVKPFILRADGTPVMSLAEVKVDIHSLRERLAPIGIRVDFDDNFQHIHENPSGVSSDGIVDEPFSGAGSIRIPDDCKKLYSALSGASGEISIYYTNRLHLTTTSGGEGNKGTSLYPNLFDGTVDSSAIWFANRILINCHKRTKWTLPHEMLHILLQKEHTYYPYNEPLNRPSALWYAPVWSGTGGDDTFESSKRISDRQAIDLYESKNPLLQKPQ